MSNGVNIMGIDPGLSGGIAILGPYGILLEPIPTIENEIDIPELNRIFSDHAADIRVAYIEKVHAMPKQGVSSMFKFGKVYGILQGLLLANGIPYVEVRPQEWTKAMHEGLTHKQLRGQPKERSRIAFKRLFPDVDAKRTPRCEGPDDGLVDAALIAQYGRRYLIPVGRGG